MRIKGWEMLALLENFALVYKCLLIIKKILKKCHLKILNKNYIAPNLKVLPYWPIKYYFFSFYVRLVLVVRINIAYLFTDHWFIKTTTDCQRVPIFSVLLILADS